MGGPRASTLRQIQRGQICALCHVFLSPPLGERVCEHCTPTVQRKPPASARIHCVFMRYHLIDGVWLVDYVQRDMRTAIGRQRRILNSEKLRDLAQRGAEDKDLASMGALEFGSVPTVPAPTPPPVPVPVPTPTLPSPSRFGGNLRINGAIH